MSRNVALIIVLLLSLSILTSGAVAMPSSAVTILPADCKLLAEEELLLSLDGPVHPDTTIVWEVDKGGITSVLPGQSAIFIAPSETTVVTISVSFSPAAPGMEAPITRQCIIVSPSSVPSGVAQSFGHFFNN